jgi:hypothetical protein
MIGYIKTAEGARVIEAIVLFINNVLLVRI